MDLASLLLGLGLLFLIAVFVLRPIFEPDAHSDYTQPQAASEELLARREAVLAALADLDFDYATGKIDDANHTAQRAQLVAEGAEILKQLDSLGIGDTTTPTDLDNRIEQAVAHLREGNK